MSPMIFWIGVFGLLFAIQQSVVVISDVHFIRKNVSFCCAICTCMMVWAAVLDDVGKTNQTFVRTDKSDDEPLEKRIERATGDFIVGRINVGELRRISNELDHIGRKTPRSRISEDKLRTGEVGLFGEPKLDNAGSIMREATDHGRSLQRCRVSDP